MLSVFVVEVAAKLRWLGCVRGRRTAVMVRQTVMQAE
jgi:hypothetical protein